MVEEDIYTYHKLPWMSKSNILGYRFCSHLFKLRYIEGVDTGHQISAETGTNMHVIYNKFFDYLDYDEVKKIVINYTDELENTKIYKYFFKQAMELMPVESRGYEPYQIRIKNFVLLETAHWIELSRKYKENYNKILKFFIPKFRERFLDCEPLMIFGSIDRKNILEENDSIQIIYDYKTGNVPADVKKGTKNSDPYSWTLPTKRNFELHFYLVLEMYRRGFILDPKLIEFCTNEKYFYEDVEFPDIKSYFYEKKLDKRGNEKLVPVDPRKYYRLGIIYSGNNEPWVPKKYPNKKSLKSVFVWINKLRTVLYNNGPYIKNPDYWTCKNCNEEIMHKCLNEKEHEMIFWGGNNESSKNV